MPQLKEPNDTLKGLSGQIPHSDVLVLTVRGNTDIAALQTLPCVREVSQQGDTLSVTLDVLAEGAEQVFAALRAQRVVVESFHTNRASLESFFLTLTGRQLRDENK